MQQKEGSKNNGRESGGICMKIKNLLLLFILLNGFSARPSFCAGEPVAHAAGREDSAALAGAGRGAGAGAADGVVGLAEAPFAPLAVGPLAKIELLRGSLAGIPQSMQGASLLHGAMLWEMGIVKMLYAMLITPIEKGGRMVPDAAICPLGAVLNELCYLAGGSLQISGMEFCLAQRLNPAGFGRLYASIIYNTDIALPISKKHKSKKKS